MKFDIILNEQTPCLNPIENVEQWIKDNGTFIEEFLEFAKSKQTAIGLAGNQVSVDGERCMHRVFAKKNLITKEWSIIINPQIEAKLGMLDNTTEGCLTWPNCTVLAKRSRRVVVSYYNIKGEKITSEITKFNSHIWQHEIDHLDGRQEHVFKHTAEFNSEIRVENPKIQRNDKCLCGSGLKYKKCC